MNEEKKRAEIKKEDSKKIPFFIIALVVLSVLGGIFGYLMASQEKSLDAVLDFFKNNSQIVSIFFAVVFLIFGLVATIIAAVKLRIAKKLWAKEEERDDNWDRIEDILSDICTFTSSAIILSFFLYGCAVYNIRGNLKQIDDGIRSLNILYYVFFTASIIAILGYNFAYFYIQKKTIDLEKIMNPEKKGSLYDFRFLKKWYEGYDEAERKQVGIASYKAFKIVNTTCATMLVLLLFLGMVVNITILPLLTVAVIWLSQIISFGIECKLVSHRTGLM
ncbi:MAG: DUF3169 family protein [Lachnospiraceae bacterium]|nr:DUF3169 family protein [Lachnospiraceae bacterium]